MCYFHIVSRYIVKSIPEGTWGSEPPKVGLLNRKPIQLSVSYPRLELVGLGKGLQTSLYPQHQASTCSAFNKEHWSIDQLTNHFHIKSLFLKPTCHHRCPSLLLREPPSLCPSTHIATVLLQHPHFQELFPNIHGEPRTASLFCSKSKQNCKKALVAHATLEVENLPSRVTELAGGLILTAGEAPYQTARPLENHNCIQEMDPSCFLSSSHEPQGHTKFNSPFWK